MQFFCSMSINMKELLSWPVLLAILLPIMGILGMSLVNFWGNNSVLLALVVLITVVVTASALDLFPCKYYPLAILTIAIALVLRGSLKTFYVAGEYGDMAYEFYYYTLVISNSYWNPTYPSPVNAMLSVTVLPAMYSNLLNMAGEWIFRVIYPLIFAFVPLALFQTYEKHIGGRTALLSAFFFMSAASFFESLPLLPRQEIAELFLALSILVMAEKKMSKAKRTPLLILFSFTLIVAHYGTSYIYLFYITLALLLCVARAHSTRRTTGRQLAESQTTPADRVITGNFVMLCLVFALFWYMHNASSSAFLDIVGIGRNLYDSLFTDFFNPTARESEVLLALALVRPPASLWYYIYTYVTYITQFFIVAGVIYLVFNPTKKASIGREQTSMILTSCLLLFLALVLPHFSAKLTIGRLYHLTLFFLAPCFVVGGQIVLSQACSFLKSKLGKPYGTKFGSLPPILLVGILLLYFLFNTHFILVFTEDVPKFNALTLARYRASEDINERAIYLLNCIPKQDFVSAKWLSEYENQQSTIYADYTAVKNLLKPYPLPPSQPVEILLPLHQRSIETDSFIYLRTFNLETNKIITGRTREGSQDRFNYYDAATILPLLNNRDKIYSNGGSEIYR